MLKTRKLYSIFKRKNYPKGTKLIQYLIQDENENTYTIFYSFSFYLFISYSVLHLKIKK